MGRRSGRWFGRRSGVAEPTAVVIGASMAGLCAAAALARSGVAVTVLERDRLPERPESRRGVPQDTQAHVLLYRGQTVIEDLLPGFRADLLRRGAVSYDSGRMPWLGEYGWLGTDHPGYEVLSATRPLMEAVTRNRVAALAGVRFRDGASVIGLTRSVAGWQTEIETEEHHEVVTSRLVIDASGRTSRLSRWSPGPETPTVEEVDAHVGYATRLYRQRGALPLRTGLMIFGTPGSGTAGLALPVEDHQWLITGAGFGDRRPPRDAPGFRRFLTALRDPAVADLVSVLEPAGDVTIHRQTANRRHRWDRVAHWPDGLLVVGDALCSLNPVYGQGITVAALQAQALGAALGRGLPVDRSLQRRMVAVTQTPWSIATTADLRQPTCSQAPGPAQRISIAWAERLGRLAAAGDLRAAGAIVAVNNLMASPTALLHPALLLAGSRPAPAGRLPRPPVLAELSPARREQPPAAPADA
jgi:flavin-dependent dehydrogenase